MRSAAGSRRHPQKGDCVDRAPANCHDAGVSSPIDLLVRPVYGMGQVDRILSLSAGTARRWVDGYQRGGKGYPPLIRESSTDDDIVTWGEFVETRLIAEFREAGVPLIRLRPAIARLRQELQTPYPLASARTWLDSHGKELVRRVQDDVKLDGPLSLVVVRSGQGVLDWSEGAQGFMDSIEWQSDVPNPQVVRLRPCRHIPEVVLDPLVGSGEPTLRGRGIRTEIIAELFKAGETTDGIAQLYELDRAEVDAAVRYELVISGATVKSGAA